MSRWLSAAVLYRTAAVILVLFAAGHTFGFLSFRPPTADGLAVFDSMNRVQFTVGGVSYSYGRFYTGFGLSITASQLFSAVLAWWMGGVARRQPQELRFLAWAFVALQVAGLVLSWIYFGPGPAVFSLLLLLLLAAATLRLPRST